MLAFKNSRSDLNYLLGKKKPQASCEVRKYRAKIANVCLDLSFLNEPWFEKNHKFDQDEVWSCRIMN